MDSKAEKIQTHFQTLSKTASSLNIASDGLTQTVSILNEALQKLNIGLTVWVVVRADCAEDEPYIYDHDEIGYCKVNGVWGIALQHVRGDASRDEESKDGPWLFNDAPRELRLAGVDKIPDLIEALSKEALKTTKRVQEKTNEVRAVAEAIQNITASEQPPSRGTMTPASVQELIAKAKPAAPPASPAPPDRTTQPPLQQKGVPLSTLTGISKSEVK
jgi:hypothetical protein